MTCNIHTNTTKSAVGVIFTKNAKAHNIIHCYTIVVLFKSRIYRKYKY